MGHIRNKHCNIDQNIFLSFIEKHQIVADFIRENKMCINTKQSPRNLT